jgi:hypothetical protein
MNFRLWLESVDFGEIRARAQRLGLDLYRGECGQMPQRGFRRDVGDFGRGVYYTSVEAQARVYGGGSCQSKVVQFENPLVMNVQDAYELSDSFNILHPPKVPEELVARAERNDPSAMEELKVWRKSWDPLKNAEEMTKYFLKQNIDGLIVVHSDDRLEVVDYRPYRV